MIKNDTKLTKEYVLNGLKSLDYNTYRYQTAVEFIFEPCIVNLMKVLDEKFNSELGRPAYSRIQLLSMFIFAEINGVTNISDIPVLCETNDIFKILTPGDIPQRNTLSKFLDTKDEDIFLSIYLYTLVKLNDYHYLDNIKDAYLDGTDALVNGSVNYLIHEDEIEALELLNKWKLLHDNTESKIEDLKHELKKKLIRYKNDSDKAKLIGLALKRPKLYNKYVFKKIDKFKQALLNYDKKYVSVNFPESVKLPSKRGKWEMGLNLQELMSDNHIVLSGFLLRKSNDFNTLNEVTNKISHNIELLKAIQEEYGERNNTKFLEDLFHIDTWCDSGFDDIENQKARETSTLNFLFLPKKLSKQINDKLRKKVSHFTDKKDKKKSKKCGKITPEERDDISIKDCERVKGGYNCPYGGFIELIKIKDSNCKFNKENDLSDYLQKKNFKHECKNCSGCPYYLKYGKKCSVAKYTEHTSLYIYQLTELFLTEEYKKGYVKRFSIGEGINGYLKGKLGILRLFGNNINAAENHLHIKNIIYNLTRFVKLKDSIC